MIITEDVFKQAEEDRGSSDGTEIPELTGAKLISHKDSISGLLALSMLGIALVIIILSLWSQKQRRKPMLMQCRQKVKSYHTMCAIPSRLQYPQYMGQINKDDSNRYTLRSSNKIIPLVHNKRKILAHKIYISPQQNNKIMSVSELWREKSKQSNNYFLINVIPEEEGN